MLENSTFINPLCPHLPDITDHNNNKPLPITHTRKHRQQCGPQYFQACLELAQSIWLIGNPAQAILQLDKSFMAMHPENIAHAYHAILWIIKNTPPYQFLGNPVRHFQHLATRMNLSQPNAELRIWRAWSCLHLTEKYVIHSAQTYPRDTEQIQKEKLTIPTIKETLMNIDQYSNILEGELLEKLLFQCR